MYGSEIWGCFHPNKLKSHKSFFNLCNDSIIEKLKVKSCNYILGIPRRCTNSSVMSELGRYSLYFNIILNLVKYWIRLEKSDNTLLKEFLRMSKNLHENGCTSWNSCIYNMFQFLDISPHYILQGKVNVKKLLIKKLTSIYGNVWKSELFNDIRKDSNQKNKLRTFKLFKSSFYF
jgi:hypothetical protein